MKQFLAFALALSLLVGCGSVAATDLPDAIDLDDGVAGLVTDDLSAYENGEVLVLYTDGSFDVLTCETEETLATTLETLAADETVALVQPNYTYADSDFSTTDALTAQQWALHNDGTFYMEEEENSFPVFDSPFSQPSAPGHWTPPSDFGRPGGRMRAHSYQSAATTQTAAQAGIDLNAEEAWAIYDGGNRDVVVTLIDTGIDYTHEDLSDALWVNADEITDNGIDDDGNGYIDDVYGWNFYSNNNQIYTGSEDSHGTHGAGTIAATADNCVGIAGIVQSDHVKVMAVKALGGDEGTGSTISIIQAIRYAEANGASICNLSLGSEQDDRALYWAIASSSMLFVVAAGNNGADIASTPCYPASYDLDNIISVANLNYDGNLHYSSNYGTAIDLAAPGSYILSTTPENSYSYMTGTSMSAPMVTAAAAMVYSYFEDCSLADVKEILLSSARPLDTLAGLTSAGGMLDLGAALSYDLSALSGKTWVTVSSTGSNAPVISVQTLTYRGRQYLSVQITDADGDLTVTAYADGTLTASQFQGGTVGQTFVLSSSGSALFTTDGDGVYTLYAADHAGHETVYTVTLADSLGNLGW